MIPVRIGGGTCIKLVEEGVCLDYIIVIRSLYCTAYIIVAKYL